MATAARYYMIIAHQDRPSCRREPIGFVYSSSAVKAREIAAGKHPVEIDIMHVSRQKYIYVIEDNPSLPLWVDESAKTSPYAGGR
jgi:hypothetical protein